MFAQRVAARTWKILVERQGVQLAHLYVQVVDCKIRITECATWKIKEYCIQNGICVQLDTGCRKQAAAKQTFVFPATATRKRPMKSDIKREARVCKFTGYESASLLLTSCKVADLLLANLQVVKLQARDLQTCKLRSCRLVTCKLWSCRLAACKLTGYECQSTLYFIVQRGDLWVKWSFPFFPVKTL